MRSIRHLIALAIVAALLAVISGCSGGSREAVRVPRIESFGTRAFEYTSLDQLAQRANAIVVIKATGKQSTVPLPTRHGGSADSAPTPFVEMKVIRVVAGSVQGDVINVVSPGIDQNTGEESIAGGGAFLAFVAPAMYAPNDPVGGYAIVGGPAGLFVAGGNGEFTHVDTETPKLPAELAASGPFPKISKTEQQLLSEGP